MPCTPATASWPRTPTFAQAVADAGLVWIGPPAEVITTLGDKVRARAIAEKAGAPLAPGTEEPVADSAEAVAFAEEHGLPLAIKAAHGGGGRGLRVARTHDEVAELFDSAVREATAAFGRGECFLETYLEQARHVEVQVLADAHGTIQILGTRDCSLQRRYQKVVEEAPAPFLEPQQRAELESAAAAICREAGYVNAGTVEFLLSADGHLAFLEVNTRLQVEHSVTEETVDVDVVRAQLRIAAGHRLDVGDASEQGHQVVEAKRHALEFRINAEDPDQGFLPSTGTISLLLAAQRPRRTTRLGGADRQRGERAVRLAAREAGRHRSGPHRGARTRAASPRRVRDRRCPDHAPVPARRPDRAGLRRRRS